MNYKAIWVSIYINKLDSLIRISIFYILRKLTSLNKSKPTIIFICSSVPSLSSLFCSHTNTNKIREPRHTTVEFVPRHYKQPCTVKLRHRKLSRQTSFDFWSCNKKCMWLWLTLDVVLPKFRCKSSLIVWFRGYFNYYWCYFLWTFKCLSVT